MISYSCKRQIRCRSKSLFILGGYNYDTRELNAMGVNLFFINDGINHYEIGEMPASTKEYYLSYGNDFDTAWLNAMYTDVYVYSGKYSNLDAWDQFTQYIAFYDEVVDYDNERAPAPELYDVYYAYDPDTEEEAGQCVDEVIRIAEESGAEIQFY